MRRARRHRAAEGAAAAVLLLLVGTACGSRLPESDFEHDTRSAAPAPSGGTPIRVGIITRAAHPSPHLACGHLTRWAPLTAYDPALVGDPVAAEAAMLKQETQARAEKSARLKKTNAGTLGSLNLLGAFLPVQRTGSGLTRNASAAG